MPTSKDGVAERTEALNEALTQMQEFTYTVSHDLRSPVRAMQGYAAAIFGALWRAARRPRKGIFCNASSALATAWTKLIRDVRI